jgi:hypothetical protein
MVIKTVTIDTFAIQSPAERVILIDSPPEVRIAAES